MAWIRARTTIGITRPACLRHDARQRGARARNHRQHTKRRSMGMKRITGTALLAGTLTLGGCQSPPNVNVERRWADTMQRLGMFAFYPMYASIWVGPTRQRQRMRRCCRLPPSCPARRLPAAARSNDSSWQAGTAFRPMGGTPFLPGSPASLPWCRVSKRMARSRIPRFSPYRAALSPRLARSLTSR